MARKFNAIASRRAPIKPGIMGQAPKGEGMTGRDAFTQRPHTRRARLDAKALRDLGGAA
jgi:hypothetical protein